MSILFVLLNGNFLQSMRDVFEKCELQCHFNENSLFDSRHQTGKNRVIQKTRTIPRNLQHFHKL